ncbi:hypothetical protein PAPHI01_1410 [Pancytospora philotis]|nr:hypothetical protein PAPHI01_1410 [Pancytospora philotis]
MNGRYNYRRQEDIDSSIFSLFDHIPRAVGALYDELLSECMDGHTSDRFHSDIELDPDFDAGEDYWMKRRFIMEYLLACKDSEAMINRLMPADSKHSRYEVLFDLFDSTLCPGLFHDADFKVTDAGKRRSEMKVEALQPLILELLRRKIAEGASVSTAECLGGVYTADTVLDAFTHLLRGGRYVLHTGLPQLRALSYSDLSDLLASALKSGDRNQTIEQFVRPLMDYVVELWPEETGHAWRCAQAVRAGLKDMDKSEAKDTVKKIFDWKKFSLNLMWENAAKYPELAAEMELDPRDVTEYISDFYRGTHAVLGEARPNALSAYYLGVSGGDGQTRLRKIIDDRDLISGLPRRLIPRLLEDCTRLRAERCEEADHLIRRLHSIVELRKKRTNKFA